MARTPFKQRSSPVKGRLQDFFSSVGSKIKKASEDIKEGTKKRQATQRAENEGGLTNFEKRRAEKKTRKAGESKFQADVRRRGEKKKPKKRSEISVDEQIKAADKQFGEGVQVTAEKSNSSQTFKQAFAAARKANKKTFSWNGKSYTTKLA
jgi:hypothetical protein